MILFPNAKINLGLNILRRRPDGYHDIATVMAPVAWSDILEIVPSEGLSHRFHATGRPIDCDPSDNLVMKALSGLETHLGYALPPLDIYLEKIIPDGAGLGGGSADASFTLVGVNSLLGLGLSKRALAEVASRIGADCPFFIYNAPAICTGTGTDMTHISLPALKDRIVLIAKPRTAHVSTRAAYSGVRPHPAAVLPEEILQRPIEEWQGLLVNDFEESVIPLAPEIGTVKQAMLQGGALYASMSGSGSAVYGIFDNVNMAQMVESSLTDCDSNIGTFL